MKAILRRMRIPAVLGIFTVAFIALTVNSYVRESATWDEPFHLTAGYTALRFGDYRVDPEHPPVLRMWAALPLLAMPDVHCDTNVVSWTKLNQWKFGLRFLYHDNDADRLLYRARFMIVLLGVLLGYLVFSWTRELFGGVTAMVVLALYTFEPNILSHARLVTTDFGLVCFFFGAIYFLWRTTRRLNLGNVAGLALFFTLALVSKFSAVLLIPSIAMLLGIHSLTRSPWRWRWRARAGQLGRSRKWIAGLLLIIGLLLAGYGGIWAAYRFRYAPGPLGQGIEPVLRANPPPPQLAAIVEWSNRHRLLPGAYASGFLEGQTKAEIRPSFLAGHYSQSGWWCYFPFAILVKTPVSLLLLWTGTVVLWLCRRTGFVSTALYLLVPSLFFLLAGMTSKLDIGLRHLLPIYPLLLVFGGQAVAELLRRRRSVVVGLILAASSLELMSCYPHCLAFFNICAGGPANGYRLLVDSNLDWGQDLKGLARWMKNNHIPSVYLSYFGTADPAYYHIVCRHLSAAPFADDDQIVSGMDFPCYVAASVTQLQGVYANDTVRRFYAPLLKMKPVTVIGYSIRVYRVEKPWWPAELGGDYSSSGSSSSPASGVVKPSPSS